MMGSDGVGQGRGCGSGWLWGGGSGPGHQGPQSLCLCSEAMGSHGRLKRGGDALRLSLKDHCLGRGGCIAGVRGGHEVGADCGGQAQGSGWQAGEERVALREMQKGRLAEWTCQSSGPVGHLLCDLGKLLHLSESQHFLLSSSLPPSLTSFLPFAFSESTPGVEPNAGLDLRS